MKRPRATTTYCAVFFLSLLFSPDTTPLTAAHDSNHGGKRNPLLFGKPLTTLEIVLPWKRRQKGPRRNIHSNSHSANQEQDDIFEKNSLYGTDDESSEDEQYEQLTSRSVTATILAALQSMVKSPRFRHITANSIQLGLIMYLARAIWQSATEVIDEYSKEMTGFDPAFGRPDQVQRLVEFLEQDTAVLQARLREIEAAGTSSLSKDLPSLQLLSLARKLLLAGMPLRREKGNDTQNSVESVLLSITKSEAALLQQCLWTPSLTSLDDASMREAWNNVAGLESVKLRLLDSVANIRGRHATASSSKTTTTSSSSLHSYASLFEDDGASGGILLFGPPGCGKTMLIKALAGTTRLPCLIISPSVLLRKYVGDTNLQVRSLFSLTRKLAPCVLCIDELDGLFRERNANEHEVSRDLKTEFLQWWDGMLSSTARGKRVLVVGATNRPFDVDSAVLRRLPQSYFIGLPDLSARTALLTQLLRNVPTEPDLDVASIAARTGGYSPSDIRQLLQTAAMTGPLREAHLHSSTSHRPLSNNDILRALDMVRPTPMSHDYRTALGQFAGSHIQPASSNDNQHWETDGSDHFIDAGTLEVDNETFELLTDIADEMETLSDDRDNDDSDFEL